MGHPADMMTMIEGVPPRPEATLPVLDTVTALLPEVAVHRMMNTTPEMAMPDVLRLASMDRHRDGMMTHMLAAVRHHLHVATMILTPETILMRDPEVRPLLVAMAATAVAVVAAIEPVMMRDHTRYALLTSQTLQKLIWTASWTTTISRK